MSRITLQDIQFTKDPWIEKDTKGNLATKGSITKAFLLLASSIIVDEKIKLSDKELQERLYKGLDARLFADMRKEMYELRKFTYSSIRPEADMKLLDMLFENALNHMKIHEA